MNFFKIISEFFESAFDTKVHLFDTNPMYTKCGKKVLDVKKTSHFMSNEKDICPKCLAAEKEKSK
jgi:hypothetical protein